MNVQEVLNCYFFSCMFLQRKDRKFSKYQSELSKLEAGKHWRVNHVCMWVGRKLRINILKEHTMLESRCVLCSRHFCYKLRLKRCKLVHKNSPNAENDVSDAQTERDIFATETSCWNLCRCRFILISASYQGEKLSSAVGERRLEFLLFNSVLFKQITTTVTSNCFIL